MTTGPRYAVYFVPHPDTSLYRFGAEIVGCDCYSGGDVDQGPDPVVSGTNWAALTREPRAYGFHATLKAPFHLYAHSGEADLVAAFRMFAATPQRPLQVAPSVEIMQDFAAVVSRQASPDLDAFAGACVSAFDRFRAPMTTQERARRQRPNFSARQIANIDRWGYPYVFEDFRFHMTLTGPIPRDQRPAVLTFLRERFSARHGMSPFPVDHIALLRQDHPSARFRVISHHDLPITLSKL